MYHQPMKYNGRNIDKHFFSQITSKRHMQVVCDKKEEPWRFVVTGSKVNVSPFLETLQNADHCFLSNHF